MAGENWTFWFNLTNFALGMITILAVLVVFAAVGWDLFGLWLHKARRTDRVGVTGVDMERIAADLRAHWRDEPPSLTVPGLGLTMADGGEKIEPSDSQPPEKTQRGK
jgi:hypothetical protein